MGVVEALLRGGEENKSGFYVNLAVNAKYLTVVGTISQSELCWVALVNQNLTA